MIIECIHCIDIHIYLSFLHRNVRSETEFSLINNIVLVAVSQ